MSFNFRLPGERAAGERQNWPNPEAGALGTQAEAVRANANACPVTLTNYPRHRLLARLFFYASNLVECAKQKKTQVPGRLAFGPHGALNLMCLF